MEGSPLRGPSLTPEYFYRKEDDDYRRALITLVFDCRALGNSRVIRIGLNMLLAVGLLVWAGTAPVRAEVPVIKVVTYDHALADAFRSARSTLATALAATEKRHGRFSPSLALRAALHVPDPAVKVELIWIDTIRRKGKGFEGRLAGHPQHMPGKRMGSRVTFTHSQIADWAVQADDGRYYDYFTTRVALKYLDEAAAKEVRAILVPRTVPHLWEQLP